MIPMTRRSVLLATLAAAHLRSATVPLRIGVTDWNLNLGADPQAVALAARLGFAGVQISFGRKLVDGRMPADQPGMMEQYRRLSAQHNVPIDGTCVDRLHDNGLKSDPLAPKWVLDSIRLTKEVGATVLLLPFFGRWKLTNTAEMDFVADALRDLAVEAGKANVVLGLEDTISAEDNVRIVDRVASPHVRIYYDVGNSTQNGFDINREIRFLGKDRICQFHLKDNPHYLGEGSISFRTVLQSIRDIGWSGFANLETDAHPATLEADMRRNLQYIRALVNSTYV